MSDNNNVYYVYYHRSLFDGKIFYVGKGKNDRVIQTISRNRLWTNKVVEEGGFLPEIFKSGLTEKEAFRLEKEEIYRIGLESLVNWPEPDDRFFFIEDVIFLDQKLADNKDYSLLNRVFEIKDDSFMYVPWVKSILKTERLYFNFMEVALYFNCEVTYLKSPCVGIEIEHMYRPAILNLAGKD